jgi:hypothetical protein
MNSQVKFEPRGWAVENFRGCGLGDQRRGSRLVTMAEQIVDRPSESLPKIASNWSDLKAIYRLLDRPETNLDSVTEVHRREVKRQRGRFLVLSDTTHVDFGRLRKINGAGPVGPGSSKGFLLHSGLLIDLADGALAGLAGQVCHVRKQRQGPQNASQRAKRWRESEMWIELFEKVGPPPPDSQYIHVCDSAADNFEAFCTLISLRADFVIRAGRSSRAILTPDGRRTPLSEYVEELDDFGQYDLDISRGNRQPARVARLHVRAGKLEVPLPRHLTPRMREFNGPIPMHVIVVEEQRAPRGNKPIRWILFTSLPINSMNDAWNVIGYYENRWLVEEWHKALKTGCALEGRQLQDVDRMLALTGVLSVVAVLLVQLKTIAQGAPETPAAAVVPSIWLSMLRAKHKLKSSEPTIREFWWGVAQLGGFLARRGDGPPGWQTLWSGWLTLHHLVDGARALRKEYEKCG